MTKRCRRKSGETLVETLAAILVISLASAILAGVVSASSGIAKKTDEAYNVYERELSNAENRTAQGTETITINGNDITVNYSGSDGELRAYWE